MQRLQRFAPTLAVVAALLLVAGLLAWLLGGPTQQFGLVRDLLLVGGAILLVAYILLRPGDIGALFGQRRVRYGTNAAIQVLALVAILVVVNYFTLPVSDTVKLNKQWDLTEAAELSLAPETIQLLQSLQEPVQAYGVFTTNSAGLAQQTSDRLKQYEYYGGDKFRFEIVDPLVDRSRAIQIGATRDGSVILFQGEQRQEAEGTDEASITTAITKLTRPNQPVVYFVQGHGEYDLDSGEPSGLSAVKQGLEANNFVVRSLVITTTLPSDAAAVIMAGPKTLPGASELQVLSNYLAGGGSFMLLREPDLLMPEGEGQPWGGEFSDYLTRTWGLNFRNDILIDAQSGSQDGLVLLVTDYGFSTITQPLANQFTVFPTVRSIETQAPGAGLTEVSRTPLVQSTANSWSLPNLEGAPDLNTLPRGPFVVGVSAENTSTRGRIVVFGDAEAMTNQVAQDTRLRNAALFVNSVNWLTRQEQLVSITPKQQIQRALRPVTPQQQALVGLVTAFGLPLLAIALGLGVWWQRRKA
jgi:ABC-type uncharacterized transport system involved in gliding motility auxiliary subunit